MKFTAALSTISYPDRRLKKKSAVIKDFTENTRTLCSNLGQFLIREGLTSIAAPQVGIFSRVGVIYDSRFGLVALANPVITASEGIIMVPESCPSFPGMAAVVYRPTKITVCYRTVENKEVSLEFDGQAAAAIAKLCDVFDGITIKDRNKISQKELIKIKALEEQTKAQEKENETRTDVKETGDSGERSEQVFNDWGSGPTSAPQS